MMLMGLLVIAMLRKNEHPIFYLLAYYGKLGLREGGHVVADWGCSFKREQWACTLRAFGRSV